MTTSHGDPLTELLAQHVDSWMVNDCLCGHQGDHPSHLADVILAAFNVTPKDDDD